MRNRRVGGVNSGSGRQTVAVMGFFLLAACAAAGCAAPGYAAQAKPYRWQEIVGADDDPPTDAAPKKAGPPASAQNASAQNKTEAEIRAMIEREASRIEKEAGRDRPADLQFQEDAERILNRDRERREEREREAARQAQASGPGAWPHLIDAGQRLWNISETITNRVTYVAVSVSILFFLVALLMWYTGIFTTGEFANPVIMFNRAAIAFVLLLSTPYIMWAVDSLCVGAAETIDISFSGGPGFSSTKEVYRKIAEGMANHSEDYTAQTLTSDTGSAFVFGLGWIAATMFYAILRAIWEMLWIALKIIAPLAAMAYMVNGEFGSAVFKAWFKSVLCVSSWPVGWAIIFGMINAGVEDFSRTEPGTLYQVAFLCYLLALLVMAVPGLATAFWSGEGVDRTLGAFGQGVANAAVSGLGALGGVLRNAAPEPFGQIADMAGGAAGLVYGQGAAVADGAARGHIPNIAGAHSAWPGGLNLGATGTGAVSAAGVFAAVTGGTPDVTAAVAAKTGLPGGGAQTTPTASSPTASSPTASSPTASSPTASGPTSSALPPKSARSERRLDVGTTAAAAAANAGRTDAPAGGVGANARAGEAAPPGAAAPTGAQSAAGAAFTADFTSNGGATIAPRPGTPTGRFGQATTDPGGADGVRAADGVPVHKGDTVAYTPPTGLPAGHYYQGEVTGFTTKGDSRYPTISAREMDSSGRPVSGVPQQIQATDWSEGNPGQRVTPAHAPPAVAAPRTEGPGVVTPPGDSQRSSSL